VDANLLLVDPGESRDWRSPALGAEGWKGLNFLSFSGRSRDQHLRGHYRPLTSPAMNPNLDHSFLQKGQNRTQIFAGKTDQTSSIQNEDYSSNMSEFCLLVFEFRPLILPICVHLRPIVFNALPPRRPR
jgi:hypothetical protein